MNPHAAASAIKRIATVTVKLRRESEWPDNLRDRSGDTWDVTVSGGSLRITATVTTLLGDRTIQSPFECAAVHTAAPGATVKVGTRLSDVPALLHPTTKAEAAAAEKFSPAAPSADDALLEIVREAASTEGRSAADWIKSVYRGQKSNQIAALNAYTVRATNLEKIKTALEAR